MGCILTCCIDSTCGCCGVEEEPCCESDTYEAVAAATSESTTVEPGKLDVRATEGHDLQHINNKKLPTGPPEDSLSLKSLTPSEKHIADVQILPSVVQGSSEDNLNLIRLPPSETGDWENDDNDEDDEDVDIIQIFPLRDQGPPEDSLSLKSLTPSEKHIDDVQILPSLVQGPPEDSLSLKSLTPSEKHIDDVQILPSLVQDISLGVEDRMKIHSGFTAEAPMSWKWREKHNREHTVSIPFLHLNENVQFYRHLWKRLSFPHWVFLAPLLKIS
ncbi:aspartate-rich protein 1 isoform X3 [Rhinopithecus roxellana]|uniref:aspartate-rich protein 1 isoform X3 n=1 Tax=Rhinopithecus roxellana TaxID=61622 RepID=UPI0012370EE4|nr:aspartate-rich protein 1 isoform X3 [Rhinopithecus roxellana]